jgi:hypothetical protein
LLSQCAHGPGQQCRAQGQDHRGAIDE